MVAALRLRVRSTRPARALEGIVVCLLARRLLARRLSYLLVVALGLPMLHRRMRLPPVARSARVIACVLSTLCRGGTIVFARAAALAE